jgi:hypothetical protein
MMMHGTMIVKNAIHILLDCLETKHWRMEVLSDGWFNVHKEVAYRKILRCTNRDQIRNLGRYLDKVKYKV